MRRISKSVNVLIISILILFSTISYAGVLHSEIQLAEPVQDVDYSSTNNLIAVATNSQIQIYTDVLQLLNSIPRTTAPGAQIASVSWDPNVEIWEYDSVTQQFTHDTTITPSNSEVEFVSAIEWDNTGNYLSIAYQYNVFGTNSLTGQIDIINKVDWNVEQTIQNIQLLFLTPDIAWNNSNSKISSGFNYCLTMEALGTCGIPSVFIADTGTGVIEWIQGDLSNVFDVSWSPDGNYFSVSASDIVIYNTSNLAPYFIWSDNSGIGNFIEWSADGSKLLSVDANGAVRILDILEQNTVVEFETITFPEQVTSIAWDSHADALFIGTSEGRIQKWQTAVDHHR